MYELFCDTNCELWYTTARELGLNVIKMPYIIEDKEIYYDLGENTDFGEFYSKVRAGVMPKTAALNAYDYVEYFEPVLKDGKDILYITFSWKLSGTFESMQKAIDELKEKYPDRTITTFNTNSISLGAGIQVYYAAKMWKDGKTADEVLSFLQVFSPNSHAYFCVDSLKHLQRGGRISGAQAAFGTLLGIKPLLHLEPDGSIKSVGKIKGRKKVVSELANLVRKNGVELDKYNVFILHADCEELGLELSEKIKELCGDGVTVVSQIVGPVIGTHCGPGTLGVIYHGKADK